MKPEQLKIYEPKTHKEIKECLKHPKSHYTSVLCLVDNMLFTLNPFGGGTCNTNELKLSDEFEIDKQDLNKFIIIDYKKVIRK